MTKFLMFISGFCCVLYAIDWYLGVSVPAWVALLWCGATFFHDLDAYKREKAEQEFIDVVKINE